MLEHTPTIHNHSQRPKQTQNNPTFAEEFSKAELGLKIALRDFNNFQNKLAVKNKIGYQNTQIILSIFVKIASVSLRPFELILKFLWEEDLLNLASTCRSFYRLLYSPFGFKLCKYLKPVVIKVKNQAFIPTFNQAYLQNLCNDVNLINMDEDDKAAIILTMKTNLLAAKQKVREIEACNQQWERRKIQIKLSLSQTIAAKEEETKRVESILESIEKITEVLKESEFNLLRLKEEQDKMIVERQAKKNDLEQQKIKLQRQKDLLIKKIRAQQKQREEGLIYARQVTRVTNMLTKITSKNDKHHS